MYLYFFENLHKIENIRKTNEKSKQKLHVYLRDYGLAHLERPWIESGLCLAADKTQRSAMMILHFLRGAEPIGLYMR